MYGKPSFCETIIFSVCAKRPCLTDHHADDVKSSVHMLVGLVFICNRDVIFHKTGISSATNLESISSFVEIHKGEFSERIKI